MIGKIVFMEKKKHELEKSNKNSTYNSVGE